MGSNWKMKCLDGVAEYSTKDKYVCRDGYIYNSKGERMIKFKTFNSFQEFQEYSDAKWGLIINEISTKEELEDGDICLLRNGIMSILFEDKIYNTYNPKSMLDYNNETLEYMCDNNNNNKYDIMEVYRNKTLIYKREEKSSQQIEIENIQAEMEKLNKRLEVLKGEM